MWVLRKRKSLWWLRNIRVQNKVFLIFLSIGSEHIHRADVPLSTTGYSYRWLCYLSAALVRAREHVPSAVLPQWVSVDLILRSLCNRFDKPNLHVICKSQTSSTKNRLFGVETSFEVVNRAPICNLFKSPGVYTIYTPSVTRRLHWQLHLFYLSQETAWANSWVWFSVNTKPRRMVSSLEAPPCTVWWLHMVQTEIASRRLQMRSWSRREWLMVPSPSCSSPRWAWPSLNGAWTRARNWTELITSAGRRWRNISTFKGGIN